MSTAHAVMAATNLRDALDRYMEWRGIGESAVDLIPDSIRRPIPAEAHMEQFRNARDVLDRVAFESLATGSAWAQMLYHDITESERRRRDSWWGQQFPSNADRANAGPNWTHTPGNLKLCTTFVRIAWRTI